MDNDGMPIITKAELAHAISLLPPGWRGTMDDAVVYLDGVFCDFDPNRIPTEDADADNLQDIDTGLRSLEAELDSLEAELEAFLAEEEGAHPDNVVVFRDR